MEGVALFTTRNAAVRFAFTTAVKSSSLMRNKSVSLVMPAFDTKISTGPKCSSTALKAASTCEESVTSHFTPKNSAGGGEELNVMATLSPKDAKCCAQASPIPLAPPVISTTRFIVLPIQ